MPRLSEAVDDTTPLTASRIDVAARIGWLLRTSRVGGGLSLRQMSVALRTLDVTVSAATLSRIESEGQRSTAALDGYATVLGLPGGALRSTVDMLCRTFSYAPAAPPEPARSSLDRFSASFEAITVGEPTAGAWLEFTRQHTGAGGYGLPRTLMAPHVRRLADELGRSVGSAHVTRYEALAQLRCSEYADVVDAVLREIVLDPHCQLLYDLTSVLSERPTFALLQWAGEMLAHDSLFVARGASYALQNMMVVGGLRAAEWETLAPHVTHAWHARESDPARRAVLVQLCAALPPSLQSRIRETARVEAPPAGPRVWSRSRRNVHYEYARSVAAAACRQLAHHEEPLLERMLFEAMFDPRGVRMTTSTVLVAGSPFAGTLVPLLLEASGVAPDPASRTAAQRVAAACHRGEPLPLVEPWLESHDSGEFDTALTIFGRSGLPLPDAVLERGLAGDETSVRRTLYAAGMAADQRLVTIARRRGLAGSVRRAARWWASRSGRIVD